MIQTLCLVLTLLLSVLLNITHDTGTFFNTDQLFRSIIISCIIFPLYEEALFRIVLPNYIGTYLSTLLFSYLHIFMNNTKISKISCINFLITLYFGYYMTYINDFVMLFTIHSIYNFTIIVLSALFLSKLRENVIVMQKN